MKKLITLLIIAFVLQSCENKTQTETDNKLRQQTVKSDTIVNPENNKQDGNQNNAEIILGENMEEINAYTKDIYEKNGIIYIDLDFVEIKYKNVDERIIVNKNPKIRTYIIDNNTSILSNLCKELKSSELFQTKESILNNKNIITIGRSKNGKMIEINFGCYG
jgi:hypothetical protein